MSPRFTYVVLCHTDPEGALRLVRRIRALSPEAGVLVRHDVAGLFAPDAVAAAGGVDFRSDLPVAWGDWSQVEMVLEALRAARSRLPAEHYVIVSGQDYPIRDLGSWELEIVERGCDALLDLMQPQPRNVELRWSVLREPAGRGDAPLRKVVRAVGARVGRAAGGRFELYPGRGAGETRWWFGRPRRSAPPMEPVKAALWMTLSERGVVEILRRDADDVRTREFFRTVRTPDEFYFGSILNSSALTVAHGPTTAKWFEPGAPNPRWVGLEELARFARTPAAFARKIPPDVDPCVIAEADALSSR